MKSTCTACNGVSHPFSMEQSNYPDNECKCDSQQLIWTVKSLNITLFRNLDLSQILDVSEAKIGEMISARPLLKIIAALLELRLADVSPLELR